MYNFKFSNRVEDIIYKLSKKDKVLYERLWSKIKEIINSYDIEHYKNLRHDLKEFKRVQIGGKVLVFKFDKTNNVILFVDFDDHDKIYAKRF